MIGLMHDLRPALVSEQVVFRRTKINKPTTVHETVGSMHAELFFTRQPGSYAARDFSERVA